MATKKKEEIVEEIVVDKEQAMVDYYSEKVEIAPLFYDRDKYSAPVFVCWNGKGYSIPRGVSGIKVPRAVKEILDSSKYQEQIAGDYSRNHEGYLNMGSM